MATSESYIKRYMHRMAMYLERECFCKFPCTNDMIMAAIKAKGVDCQISEDCRDIHGEPVVEVKVNEWFILIAEEIYAMGPKGIVYCPPM